MGVPLAVANAPQSSQGAVQPVRRRPVVVCSLLATALLLFLVGASWLSPRTDDARLRRFVAEQKSRKPALADRQPLYGDPLSESAELGYQAALLAWGHDAQRASDENGLAQWIERLGSDGLLAIPGLEPGLAAVRRATHATAGPLDISHSDAVAMCAALRLAAEAALARGDGRAAVCAWLDEARVVCDAAFSFPHAQTLHWERWSSTALAALDERALQLLSTGLERLEVQWPLHVPVEWHLAGSPGYWLDEGRDHPANTDERLRAWRRGFDVRSEALVTCEMLLAELPAMTPPANDWPARERQWRAFLDGPIERCSGDALGWMLYLRENEEPKRFAGLARLRLLRLAVAFTLGDELPALADPFAAAPLQVEIDGNEATFRSASSDPVLIQRAVRR